jgi:hypothetical protein
MKKFQINTLLFQGQIVTTNYISYGGVSQTLVELSSHRCFDNVLKVDLLHDDDTVQTVYSNNELIARIDEARREHQENQEKEEN